MRWWPFWVLFPEGKRSTVSIVETAWDHDEGEYLFFYSRIDFWRFVKHRPGWKKELSVKYSGREDKNYTKELVKQATTYSYIN